MIRYIGVHVQSFSDKINFQNATLLFKNNVTVKKYRTFDCLVAYVQ